MPSLATCRESNLTGNHPLLRGLRGLRVLRGETSESLIHRRGTEFAELGIVFGETFSQRPPRLCGEKSELRESPDEAFSAACPIESRGPARLF
jgi:hypothetical protein